VGKLTEEAKKLFGEIRPALIATASKGGKPNVSAKGSLQVIDDDTLVFADVASPRTIDNLRENPQVSIISLDAGTRKSVRAWGTAEVLSSGPLFDEFAASMAARNMKLNNIVKIDVTDVETS
jgi:predicted pyridoxine 5'-phosphate oxidase superfamily flavin-nucleotide-binding protein